MMSVLISHANSAGARWAAWVVAGSVDAAVLLALIGVTWRVIRSRVAPQVGYCLFLLVPLKLIAPSSITLPAALTPWTISALVAARFDAARPSGRIEERTPPGPRAVAILEGKPATAGLGVDSLAVPPPVMPARETSVLRSRGTVSRQTPPETPRLAPPACAMLAWLAVVALLFGRSIRTHGKFRGRLGRMPIADATRLSIDLPGLFRLAGVRSTVRVVEDDSIASPAVCGIFRPTIVIPRGIESSLTARQLRWVLLHELAHVRRRDLSFAAFQRFVAILHFFNPAAWVANRMIDRLREYACDDLAASLNQSSAVESGEAFVGILRHVDRGRRRPEGALGLFGFDSRASCLIRVRRLLDAERPIRTSPRAWPILGLILLALFSLPGVRASGEAPPVSPQDPIKAASPPAAEGKKEFELRVVGPDGKPIPEALVEFRMEPALSSEQFRRGKFVGKTSYGMTATADAEGTLVIDLTDKKSKYMNIYIRNPGYGPYWAGWTSETHQEAIPARFTAELEAGWSAGGIVVDDEGKPIRGAKVQPHIEFKKRPGDLRQLGSGSSVTTNAAGKWRFDSVPASMGMVYVSIDHPDFQPIQRPVARGEFGLEAGREPAGKIVLSRGLTVVGKVTDEAGKPIVGALIRTKFMNEIREAKAGDDGTYRLVGCDAKAARIVVSARGLATDMKELNIEPGMGPVDFLMKPGGTVRVRVLDDKGNPAPGARIFFQRWRGQFQYFEFNHAGQYADKDGTWAWDEAPLDEFSADICPPGHDGMQLVLQPLIARREEYVFRLPATLVVSGRVIDAVSKEPIKEFRVVPGTRFTDDKMYWSQRDGFKATDGHYQIRENRVEQGLLVRIEADGYEAAVSRDIKNTEGGVTVDFELKRGKNVLGKVVTPDLQPARGAVVALGIAGSQIAVKNGEFDNQSTHSERTTADEEGRFHFAAQDKDFLLIITHPNGYAQFKGSPDWESMKIIRLKPWARVEGTFRIGRKPAPDVPLGLHVSGQDSHGRDGPNLFTSHETTTGPGGKYLFERVIPGSGRIGRELFLTGDQGASEVTSSCKVAAEFPAGKTTHLDLGGTGRAVVGKLQPPEGFDGKVRWNFALVNVAPEGDEPAEDRAYLTATVDRDGTFRIDDVPEGRYTLSASITQGIAGSLSNHRFEVPSPEGGRDEKPVDLGALELHARGR